MRAAVPAQPLLDQETLQGLLEPALRESLPGLVFSLEAQMGLSIASKEDLEPLLPRLAGRMAEIVSRDGRWVSRRGLLLEALQSL